MTTIGAGGMAKIDRQDLDSSLLDFHHNTMYIHDTVKPLTPFYPAHQVRMN